MADCQLTAGELMPVCHPCCVFLVLGITAGWLTARHHLRLEFNRLFVRQTCSFATLLQLNFSLSSLVSQCIAAILAFLRVLKDVYLQARTSLNSFRGPTAFIFVFQESCFQQRCGLG